MFFSFFFPETLNVYVFLFSSYLPLQCVCMCTCIVRGYVLLKFVFMDTLRSSGNVKLPVSAGDFRPFCFMGRGSEGV